MACTFMLNNSSNDFINNVVLFPMHVRGNVILDFLREKDSDTLFDLVIKNHTYLHRCLFWVDAEAADIKRWVSFFVESHRWKKRKRLDLGIWYQLKLVGTVCFYDIDLSNQIAYIGYWIDEKHQGNGIVTAACSKLLDVGERQLGLSTFFISCAVENYKSQRVPIRLGFSLYQTIEKEEWLHDHYVDHHVYRLKYSG